MKKKVVFIMGMGRSGSTLLDLTIGSHPDAFSLGEISHLPGIIEKGKKNWTPEGSTFWQDRFTETELKRFASGISGKRFHKYVPLRVERSVRELLGNDELFNPYTLLFSKTKQPILVDSSKQISWISNKLNAREFKQGLIDAYLLHNIRDGRAVVNSYLRANPRHTIEGLSQRWVKQFNNNKKFYEGFPDERKLLVRYEELASRPQTVLESICQLLEIEFTPEMIEYWKHDHHHIVGSRGTTALISKYRGKKARGLKRQGDYYQDPELAIKLDLRWKQELSLENLKAFNSMAGELNKPYEWN